jgi:hypothetical protein
MPVHDVYSQRKADRQREADRLSRLHGRLANARLAVFLFGLGLLYPIFSGFISFWWLAVPLLAFASLALWHERIARRRRRAGQAVRFYEQGLARLEDRWAGAGAQGMEFLDPNHLYAADLDLVGKGSLFELLSTARTHIGAKTLANWLLAPAAAASVRARQASVNELRAELDWREQLALVGGQLTDQVNEKGLIAWGREPAVMPPGWRRLALDGVVFLTVLALAAWFYDWIPLGLVFLASFGQIGYVIWQARRVQRVLAAVEGQAKDLGLLSGVVSVLEARRWNSPPLCNLRGQLVGEGYSAAAAIGELHRLLDRLAWRENAMFLPVAALLLWGTRQAYAIDGWRQRHGPRLPGWLDAIGEFEALSALANYSYEHPDEPFPEITETGTLFDGVNLKHPLMPRASCVPNSVRLDAARPLLMVSGSNMSGKSTLLRVVGTSAVMALAGLPVPAERLTLSVLTIGATLRIQDSLQEGRSRFYAEILRMQLLVERARKHQPPLLFLLDEILHGTNSHDRRLGAAGVIKGLLDHGAIGLVTTHDLALAELESELNGKAANVHFADKLDEGKLEFDYLMRPGVVRHSNALALMRAVGLEV